MSRAARTLETTILPLSTVAGDNRDLRLDSQYFSREALASDALIAAHRPEAIASVASDVKSFGAYALTNEFEYQEEGIPFLRGTNFAGDFIDFSGVLRVSPEAHALLHKSEVLPGMVLLSMSGSVGSVAVALDDWDYPVNSNQDIAKIVPRDIDPFYLASFLGSHTGQVQINRLPVGSVQQHIFLWMIERIKVPRLGSTLEAKIAACARAAYEQHARVAQSFARGETVLLDALGLRSWSPTRPLSYAARLSDVQSAGRIDAQYFRPMFGEIEGRLQATGRARTLSDILAANARGRQPLYASEGLPVINSKHVRTNRVILRDNRRAIEEGSPVVIEPGDVLVNGTGVGTIGRAAPYLHRERALPDNHVTVLRARALDPVYLAFFLNSHLGQWQIERHIKGSSGQIELYPADIARIVIWEAPDHVQHGVRDAVMMAFGEERRANQLLEASKLAVDLAVREGEPAALAALRELEEDI